MISGIELYFFSLLLRHKNPKNQTIEEKHCKKLETKERSMFEEFFKVTNFLTILKHTIYFLIIN